MKLLPRLIKAIFLNGLIALVLLVSGVFLFSNYLDNYTNHGVTTEVPDLYGFHRTELKSFFDDKDFRYVIIDSVYNEKAPKGIVLEQDPEKGRMVKPGRMIYLTINSNSTPKIIFPAIEDLTYRAADPVLKSRGFKIDTPIVYKPSDAEVVLGAMLNGKRIFEGDTLERGVAVQLVVGVLSDTELPVPNLYGKTLDQITQALFEGGFNLSSVRYSPDVKTAGDSAKSFLYRQIPEFEPQMMIRPGQGFDIFLGTDSNKIPQNKLSLTVDSTSVLMSTDTTESPR